MTTDSTAAPDMLLAILLGLWGEMGTRIFVQVCDTQLNMQFVSHLKQALEWVLGGLGFMGGVKSTLVYLKPSKFDLPQILF